MDKHTLIGFLLILAILVGYSWFSKPSPEEMERMRAYNDSVALVQTQQQLEQQVAAQISQQTATKDTINTDAFGVFAPFATGTPQQYVLENELLRVCFSSKGGAVERVEVKNYLDFQHRPLVLFDSQDVLWNHYLITANNRIVSTKDLYFKVLSHTDSSLVFALPQAEGGMLTLSYTLPSSSYLMHYAVQAKDMQQVLSQRENVLDVDWSLRIRKQERGRKFENRYSGLYYKFLEDDVENLNNERNESDKVSNKVKWLAYKDQFFSSVLIAGDYMESLQISSTLEEDADYLKKCESSLYLPFDPSGQKATEADFFFGPNQYKILKSFDKQCPDGQEWQLDNMLPLGWTIFGWINRYIIIPVFDWLGTYISNYGLVIFLLTLIIKLIILPFTFKSYMSTAKMRVLRPQIEEITSKIPEDKAMERQQATMSLYSKAGVSPMGGCLPMLLQMPILYAMFTFFPACIELRQKSFLWADDLSAYDAIVSWDTYIPIISSIYGNHVSLFCLLMGITNVLYTYISMRDQPTNNQMPAMKWMMYLMPVMFLFIFNDYAAGLSYYYLVSMLITIAQTYLFRLCINDKKVLAKLKANQSKPKKKSKFMERLEAMQKQQLEMQRQQLKKQQRR